MRPVPKNVKLVSERQAREELGQGIVSLVVAHNVRDIQFVEDYQIPKIMVFHNRLSTELGLADTPIDREDYLQKIRNLTRDVATLYISESKRRDWGGTGRVILPGIDISEYGGYTGENAEVLRVGNHFKERDLMLGYTVSQQILNGLPCSTLGINPTLAGSRLSTGFEDLKDHFRRYRLYLNTTAEGYEDGYNLAMLEAMAVGMPVVSTYNGSSPIVNGVNGFISRDIHYLRECVAMLLDNPDKAREIGEKARQTVARQFALEAFLKKWENAIQQTVLQFLKNSGVSLDSAPIPFHEKNKKNILMDFVSYPASTAYYLERALRKSHNVITCGTTIDSRVVKMWNLEALNWPVDPQDITRPTATPIAEVMKRLPNRWTPDFYFWVETGLDGIPPDLDALTIPKACYLIDTHLHLERHKEIARHFDFVFLAQKAYVEALAASGCSNVYWLPLACDPDIHGKKDADKKYDVGFVGSVTPSHTKRKWLLDEVGRHFDLRVERKFMDEMALTFSQSKIVFNDAVNNDLNMRVFEALCSGSLLATDRAPGSGLDEMFQAGEHLIIYDDEKDLVRKIRHYLDRPEERERIAEQGRREALSKHTYEDRARLLISKMEEHFINRQTRPDRSEPDKPDQYYQNTRQDILPLVPEDAAVILDV
ncbi:MAG: glycosyltransferase, partial [Nitrospinales bacterium]